MLILLIIATALISVIFPIIAYRQHKDVFHPALIVSPMCLFLYVYMPLKLINSSALLGFVNEEQASFYEMLAVLIVGAMFFGLLVGGKRRPKDKGPSATPANRSQLYGWTYFFGLIGFGAWAYTIKNVGGLSEAFGVSYGGGWSEVGYIRDAAYLTIVAIALLFSREGFNPKSKIWLLSIAAFAMPWVLLCLLGARRGPTFMITVCIAMSWFMARGKRPSFFMMAAGGALLGMFMLFLVTNRDHICLKCDLQLTTDVSAVTSVVNESNEYIFGTGCVAASRVTNKCYWGKRYLAQVTVRPIPRQLWPTKYEDTGLAELLQTAGVAGPGLYSVMGWGEIAGSAATMVADLWVEFMWLAIPVAYFIGWGFARVWRLAVTQQGFWMTEYIICCVLSVYFVTQSGEAVISRGVILSVPAIIVWWRARSGGAAAPIASELPQSSGVSPFLHA